MVFFFVDRLREASIATTTDPAGRASPDNNTKSTNYMTLRAPTLTISDRDNLTAVLSHILDDLTSGSVTRKGALDGLTHLMTAIDIGNYRECVTWLAQGRRACETPRSPGRAFASNEAALERIA